MELHPNFLGGSNATDFVIKRRRTRHAAVDPCLGFYSLGSSVQHADPRLTPHATDFHPEASTINRIPDDSSSLLDFIQPDRPLLDTTTAVQSPPYGSDINRIPCHSPDSHFRTPSDHKPTNTSSPIQIPVEEFLRRTAPKIHVKYGRRRPRAKSSEAREEAGESDDSFSPRPLKRFRSRIVNNRASTSGSSPSDHRKGKKNEQPRNRNKKVKSLAERLIQASVLSHGNPAECLFNPDLLNTTLHPCPPIDFVPDTQTSGPPPRRAWTLVDPKKAAPFLSASFQARAKQEHSSAISRPLSKWMETENVIEGSKKLNIKRRLGSQVRKKAAGPFLCPPLVLISLQDAEAAYSRSKRDNKADMSRINQIVQTPASWRQDSGVAARPPLPFVSEQPSSRPVISPSLHTSQVSDPLETLVPPIQPRGPFLDTSTDSIEQEICLDASEPDEDVSSDVLDDNQALSICPTNSVSQTSTQTQNTTSPSVQLLITPPETVRRTLKPLGSFFDGFRERGRSATMKAAENDVATKRNSSGSDISFSQRKNTTLIPTGDVLGSLRSFVRASLRNGPSVIPRQSRLPMFLQPHASMVEPLTPGRKRRPAERKVTTQTHVPDTLNFDNAQATFRSNLTTSSEPRPLSNEHNREPSTNSFSSVNILSVLQPQPYQIVLCSPSSSPAISRPRSSLAHHAPSDIDMINGPPTNTFDNFDSVDFSPFPVDAELRQWPPIAHPIPK